MKLAFSKLIAFVLITEAISQTIGEYEIYDNQYLVSYKNNSCYEDIHADPTFLSSAHVGSIDSDNIDILKLDSDDERKYWEEMDCIENIEPNYVVHTAAEETPYGINLVQALDVNDLGFSDSDAVSDMKVCILDSGLATHPDFPTKYIEGFGYYPVGDTYTDGNGHGTHVAGTIAALGGNDEGVIGVVRSPNTRIIIGKVLSDSGSGYNSDVIDGLNQCMQKGAKVVNMSLGGGGFSQTFERKVNELHEAGIVIVAAAGNGGNSAKGYPASYEHVTSVAAVDSDQDHASFSQYNEEVDLAAPGVFVSSTWIGDSYRSISGTSMASPHVAGVVALVWSHFPNVDHTQIIDVLETTAKDLGADGRDDYYGHGLVQAKAAFDKLMSDSLPPPPPPPSDFNFIIGKGISSYDSVSSTLSMGHSIGLSATNAVIELFYEGCVVPIDNTKLLEVVNEEFDREKFAEESYDFYYGIKLHTENIAGGDEKIVKKVGDNAGTISFCGAVSTKIDGIDSKISRFHTAFTLNYSLSSGSFELTTLKVEELAEATIEEVDIVGDIIVTACLCDSTFACNQNTEDVVLQDNTPISICLKQETEGEKLEFKSILLQMISDDYFYEPVTPNPEGLEEGANALTTITVNEDTSDVLVETYLVTELFSNTESLLTVKGTAEMDFNSNARSDSLREFSLDLKLSSKNEDREGTGCVLTKMLHSVID